MSGIIGQIGARSGIISGGGAASAGTVTLSGITGLDYEEGTWTPAVVGGAIGISSTYRAIYIKVGNIVHIQAYMVFNSSGNSTGLTISGLPFAAVQYGYSNGGINWSASTELTAPIIRIESQQTYFNVFHHPSGGQVIVPQTSFNASHFIFSGTYYITPN